MSLNMYTLYAVNIDADGSGSDILIDQITNQSVDPGIAEMVLGGDGVVDPAFAAVAGQHPRLTFTSTALATVLAKCGIAGLDFSGNLDAGLECWFRQIASGGTREADDASNHIKMTMKNGLLVPRTLDAQNNSDTGATINLEAIPIYDGTTAPVVVSTTADLTGTPSVGEAFDCGPIKINGTLYDSGGVQSISVDFGIDVMVVAGDGGVFPRFVAIRSRKPVITVQTYDVVRLGDLGISGSAISASTVVYLRKVDSGGTRVSDVTAQHISFTVASGRVSLGPLSAGHNQEAGTEIRITPVGASNIIAISTAAAIA